MEDHGIRTPHHRLLHMVDLACSLIGQRSLVEESEILLTKVRDILDCDGAIMRLVMGDQLHYVASVGVPSHQIQPMLSANEGIAAELRRTRRPVAIVNVPEDPLTSTFHANAAPGKFKFLSYAGAPMIAQGEVIGIVGVYQTIRRREFSPEDLELLQVLATMLAAAVSNIRLFDQLSRQQVALQKANEEADQRVRERTGQLMETMARAEGRLAASQAFATSVATELATPMNAIMGLIDSLGDMPLAAREAEVVRNLAATARGMLDTLNDVADLARLDAGVASLHGTEFSIKPWLDTLLAPHMAEAARRGLTLMVRWANEVPPRVAGDPERIGQVLANLVSNAIKFSREGTITITLGWSSVGRLLLAVRDTGVGIPTEKLPHLFSRFSPLAGAQGGNPAALPGISGLGLAVCHRLVTLMGGEITAESTPGHGSLFRVEIPLVPVAAGGRRAPAAESGSPGAGTRADAPPSGELSGLRILVVEDIAVNRKIVEHLFRGLGKSDCAFAANGLEAVGLARAAPEPFDLILMDCNLPRMDGYAASQAIRALEAARGAAGRTAIIGLAANIDDGERAKCMAAGMDEVIAKPFSRGQMLEAIRRVVGWAPAG